MKRRLLATIPVLLVVFLFSTNVFASQTVTGYSKYYTSYNTDYNLIVWFTSQGNNIDPQYQNPHESYLNRLNVQLVNKSSDYLIFNGNRFSFRLDTSISNYFTYHNYYTFDVTYQTDNVCKLQYTPYSDGTFGINFDDSDNIIVLAPNETKTYIVYIQQNISAGSGGTIEFPNNVTYAQGMMTYLSSAVLNVNIVPDNPTHNTVNNFIQNNSFPNSIIAYLDGIATRLSEFFGSYNSNISDAQNVITDSNSNHNDIDSQYMTELGYYTMANTNITNTGLSNFNLSADPVAGLGIVKNQFTYVWNKLSTYNIVYTFSLMFGIALMIIRHIKPIRRKKDD